MHEISNYIKNNEAFVFLNEEITNYYASLVSAQIYEYKQQGYDVTVKINTVGGSVYGGLNIIDAIRETEANTQAIGLAASMGLMILASGKKRTALNIASGMAHAVSGGSNEDFTQITSNSLKTLLKEHTNMKDDLISTLMSEENGETFMTANEMLEKGIIDEVIQSSKKIAVTNKSAQEAYAIYNKLNLTEKMEDLTKIKNSLQLADNASVERINEKVEELKNSLEDKEVSNKALEETNKGLEAQIQEMKNQIEESQKANVDKLINEYKESGIIDSENESTWRELAENKIELAEKGLKQLSKSAEVNVHNAYNPSEGEKKFSAMTAEEKADLARTNPEAYNKLILKEK